MAAARRKPERDANPEMTPEESGLPEPGRETWLVAVWPGMGSVAVTAGSWLSSELGARHRLDLASEEFFDIEKVEVHEGVARVGWRPSCTFHHWRNPGAGPDLLIFVGEAQPSSRGLEFCHRILQVSRDFGVSRVFTFAAMATQMHPEGDPRVFAVANDARLLDELRPHPVELLSEGQINGLNGVLLAAAAEVEVDGFCLLGEMPFFAVGVPNPRASVAVLQVFARLSGIDLDLSELERQGEAVQKRLGEILENMPQVSIDLGDEEESGETPSFGLLPGPLEEPSTGPEEPDPGPQLTPADHRRIESLFREAETDRSRALALKAELDRLGVFPRYEDRFLDLFKQGS